jgi:ribonuclease HII
MRKIITYNLIFFFIFIKYMKLFDNYNDLEVGLDECARGVMLGRVYAAAVIWPNYKYSDDPFLKLINDSKKINRKTREKLVDYIENMAIDFSVQWSDENDVDKFNILNATYNTFHKCLDNLKIKPNSILVDGNRFRPYNNIKHKCIVKGDSKYISIAAASILAKVYHDRYIIDLCNKYDKLKIYDLHHNMGYGTKNHMNAINKYGITKFHRKTFGICKEIKNIYNI